MGAKKKRQPGDISKPTPSEVRRAELLGKRLAEATRKVDKRANVPVGWTRSDGSIPSKERKKRKKCPSCLKMRMSSAYGNERVCMYCRRGEGGA